MRDDSLDEAGFTLIELLVVIIIIGILSAIAIPSYLAQREKAYRTQAVADMKNAGLAMETWATEHDGSYAGLDGADETDARLTDEGFNGSEWVDLLVTADDTTYCVVGTNQRIHGKEFVLRSDGTGKVEIVLDGTTTC